MRLSLKTSLLSTVLMGALGGPVVSVAVHAAAQDPATTVMERVMVIGTEERAEDLPGSAQFISDQVLDQHVYTDINRVLRQVPGVNLQEEEGYGNRPNIGLRGGRSERSADITLMEDGILIAPAPYASPSAYYFPRVSRMEAVEVRKGSSTIKFGPRTTSGAVNLIASSVPSDQEGEALIAYGSDNTKRAQATYGDSFAFGTGSIGFVIDASSESTDGFKAIDRVGGDTGYDIQDINAKLKVSTDPTADIFQSLELKIGATEEESHETYLGLSAADFDADPFRRYAGSQLDTMDASHRQYHVRHFVDFGTIDATTTVYHNQFSRNWYKAQDVTVGGVTTKLANAFDTVTALDALKGLTDLDGSATDNITLRANNRDYYSTGVQTDLSTEFDWGKISHALEFGARYHYDKEDRFQHEDEYAITDGVMTLATAGQPGSNANRHSTASALAFYVLDEISYENWTVIPGARFESIDLKREDFQSTGTTVRKNSVSEFVPGMSIGYAVNQAVNVFAGVHKGFAPPAPGSVDADNEESVNYELGGRYNDGAFKAELVGFFNAYTNLLGECTNSSGCSTASDGDQFNGGEVDAYGIEASFGYDLSVALDVQAVDLPVTFNYTYTQAEFQSDFESDFDEWGDVSEGHALPYIAEHQIFVSAGIVAPQWELHLSGKYMDEMRTEAGSGSITDGTDAHFVVDVAAEYEIREGARLFTTVDNVFDREYVAAGRPAGARPGKPFTVLAGLKIQL